MVCDPTSDIILRKKQSRPSKYPICFSNLSLSLLHACGCLPPCSAGPGCSRPPVRAGHRIDRSGGRTGPSADSTRPLESPADPASRGSWTRSPSPQGHSTAWWAREGQSEHEGGRRKWREGQGGGEKEGGDNGEGVPCESDVDLVLLHEVEHELPHLLVLVLCTPTPTEQSLVIKRMLKTHERASWRRTGCYKWTGG